jgi:hypothetical protein
VTAGPERFSGPVILLEGQIVTHTRTLGSSLVAALLLSAGTSPAYANPDIDLFAQLAIASPLERGKTTATRNGVTFVDEQGWYIADLPPGATTNARSAQVRDFNLSIKGRAVTCTAARFPDRTKALYTLSNLQKRVDTLLSPGGQWDKAAGGMMTVVERSLLPIGSTTLRGAAFTGPNKTAAGYQTLAVVETTGGTILLGCGGDSVAESRALTTRTFRLANGAMAGGS